MLLDISTKDEYTSVPVIFVNKFFVLLSSITLNKEAICNNVISFILLVYVMWVGLSNKEMIYIINGGLSVSFFHLHAVSITWL